MMPLMVDIRNAVVFGGERGEGLQKAEKIAYWPPPCIAFRAPNLTWYCSIFAMVTQ